MLGAAFLSISMGFTGIPRNLAAWIATFELSPYALLAVLTVFIVIPRCFLDGISVAAWPFFFLLLVGALTITVFPEIVTYLPNAMGN